MNARDTEGLQGLAEIDFFGAAGDYAELAEEMEERVRMVLASGQVLQGPVVAAFEKRVAQTSGRRHAVAVASGTDALFFALVAAGVGSGDEVLVPAVTFVASASAIVRTSATPVFVDMAVGASMDLEQAGRSVSPRTRALVYVHLFGGMGDPDAIEAFAARHGLLLIEDFAQSFGASHGSRVAGSLGLAGATSFDPTKVLGSPGSGGAVVTDDDDIAEQAKRLRLHGKQGPAFLDLGYNSQLPSLAAAILDLKLDRHEDWTARRTAIARTYCEGLSDLPVELWPSDDRVRHVWHKFVLLSDRRDELAQFLTDRSIPTRIHYDRPLHREPMFSSRQMDSELPTATWYCRRTLSLPIHSHLSDAQVVRVIGAVRQFFRE